MLNILPAAMLDGGHVSRSLVGDRARTVLAVLSVLFLVWFSLPMALFVVFMSMYRHPGPLDDVSGLSASRKLFVIVLVVVFVLSSPMQGFISYLLGFLGL
jgi:membrane-associated protease RseP (regulator of RpoE activity)